GVPTRGLLICPQDALLVRDAEELQGGQVRLRVPAVGGRVDEYCALGAPQDVARPQVAVAAGRDLGAEAVEVPVAQALQQRADSLLVLARQTTPGGLDQGLQKVCVELATTLPLPQRQRQQVLIRPLVAGPLPGLARSIRRAGTEVRGARGVCGGQFAAKGLRGLRGGSGFL